MCDACRDRLAEQLTALPRRLNDLDLQLLPAGTGWSDDRVSVTRVEAPLPARADVLSLTGPGSEDVEWVPALVALHPAVHRWTTRQDVAVERIVDGEYVQEDRTIVRWHRAPVTVLDSTQKVRCRCGDSDLHHPAGHPVLIADDDQAGVVPPREWVDMWARRFRSHFGHHTPSRTRPVRRWPELGPPPDAALKAAERQQRARTVLGMAGDGGYRPPVERPDDPAAEEWRIRFGAPARFQAVIADVRYLRVWLDRACDSHPDIATMAAELRSLTAEMARALGDTPDQQWLGRCPAVIIDRGDDTRSVCGAALWQDPHASQIQCPRCRSTWGPDPRAVLRLAGDIRQAWPLDRRRRYSTADQRSLPQQSCKACGGELDVRWREVTAPADKQRWWRYIGVACADCDAAKGV